MLRDTTLLQAALTTNEVERPTPRQESQVTHLAADSADEERTSGDSQADIA